MAMRLGAGWAAALAGAAGLGAAGMACAAEPAAEAVAAPAADAPPTPGTLNAQLAALHAPAPAAPEPGASVAVSRTVVEAAGAFQGYMHRAGALSAHFDGGGAVAKALSVAAGYQPAQLEQGAIAYGALAALQDAAFVEAVREAAPGEAARDALAARLVAEPAAVLQIPGADETAARVATEIGRRSGALQIDGEAVRKAAYAVQKEAWSKGAVEHAPERLVAVKALAAAPAALTAADQEELMGGLAALRAWSAAPGAQGRATPAVARALAVAALAALGRGGEEHDADVRALLADARGLDCLKLAKLNLYQCLAVAGPHYEDMFCLGRHAMADTGQCVTATVGWSGPLESAPALVRAVQPLAPRRPGSVAVPVALASQDGPERADAFALAPPPAPTAAELAAAAAPPAAADTAPLQLARADLPSFQDVARVAPARADPRDDADDEAPPPPARRAYARVARDDPDADAPNAHDPDGGYDRAAEAGDDRGEDDRYDRASDRRPRDDGYRAPPAGWRGDPPPGYGAGPSYGGYGYPGGGGR